MYTEVSFEYEIERKGSIIILQIEGYMNYSNGNYNVAPEGDADITAATDQFNNNWLNKLTEKEKENIIDQIIDDATYSD